MATSAPSTAAIAETAHHRALFERGYTSQIEAPSDRARVMKFRSAIFLEQFVYQVFFPLSLPLIYAVRGHAAVMNMRFLPSSEQSYISIFQYALALCMCTAIIICFAVPVENSVSWYAMLYEMAMVLIGGIFQRTMVATKYAYVPKDEYEYLMRTRVPLAKLQADQLLAGWWTLSRDTIARELAAAAGRLYVDADVARFPMTARESRSVLSRLQRAAGSKDASQSPSVSQHDIELEESKVAASSYDSNTQMPLRKHTNIDTLISGSVALTLNPLSRQTSSRSSLPDDGNGKGVSTQQLVAALLKHSDASADSMAQKLMLFVFLACLVESTSPIVIRAAMGAPSMGTSPAYTVAFVCCTYCRFWFLSTILAYLVVCIIDYRRRCNSLRRLTKLMTRGHKSAERAGRVSLFRPQNATMTAQGRVALPMLPLDSPEAIIAWLTTRRLLMEFGLRFFYRLQAYVTEALILILGITVGIIGALSLTGTSRSSPSRIADLTFATVALLDLVLLAVFLLITLRYGANANLEKDQHAAILLSRMLELQQSAAVIARGADDAAGATAAALMRTADVLHTAERALQSDNVVAPIRIAGLTADYTVLNTLIAAAASAATVAGRLLLQVYAGS